MKDTPTAVSSLPSLAGVAHVNEIDNADDVALSAANPRLGEQWEIFIYFFKIATKNIINLRIILQKISNICSVVFYFFFFFSHNASQRIILKTYAIQVGGRVDAHRRRRKHRRVWQSTQEVKNEIRVREKNNKPIIYLLVFIIVVV